MWGWNKMHLPFHWKQHGLNPMLTISQWEICTFFYGKVSLVANSPWLILSIGLNRRCNDQWSWYLASFRCHSDRWPIHRDWFSHQVTTIGQVHLTASCTFGFHSYHSVANPLWLILPIGWKPTTSSLAKWKTFQVTSIHFSLHEEKNRKERTIDCWSILKEFWYWYI